MVNDDATFMIMIILLLLLLYLNALDQDSNLSLLGRNKRSC
jgi:hypothetical protein